MDTSELDYHLPESAIAQTPADPRDSARMLTYLKGEVGHHRVSDLPSFLRPGDLLVVNNTRVLPARLHVQKQTGGKAEVLLLERIDETGLWRALVKPGRKLPPRTVLTAEGSDDASSLRVEIVEVIDDGQRLVRIGTKAQPSMSLVEETEVLSRFGEAPLPPYISTRLDDAERYQTVYARQPGSVAAPTAGLHFTQDLFDQLARQGVRHTAVELVVGLDTFRPVSADTVEAHTIHTERYHVPDETWDLVKQTTAAGGRIVAVGTTSVRALESAAARKELSGRTNLFIYGSYPWAVVDLLLTNFHMPRTTLLALLGSFTGPVWHDLYAEALQGGYRFLSFGDCMLVDRSTGKPS
jgi:S-adenosylmethionine:tRNA ribosyltransferase-isomerase